MTTDNQLIGFDNIYCNQGPLLEIGKIKFTPQGIAWKGSKKGNIITVTSSELKRAQWHRVAKNYGLRLQLGDGGQRRFDGFSEDSFDELKLVLQRFYSLPLEHKELSSRGWNWGQTEFNGNSLLFNVANKKMFEIPMEEVSQSTLNSKTEVTMEFRLMDDDDKDAMRGDQLVEMRFHIPDQEDAQQAEETSAGQFFEQVKSMTAVNNLTGETIVPFDELPFIVPRGRYEVEMFEEFMRMHGKSYDYKIMYKHIKNLFLLPKSDDVHELFVIGLNPPIRQGQTSYPFLVMQLPRDEELEIDVQLEEGDLSSKFGGRLKDKYHAQTSTVVSQVFKAITNINVAGTNYKSANNFVAIACSLKAFEGQLYPLEDCLLFLTKPVQLMPYNEIQLVTFSRVGGTASSRTCEISVTMKKGNTTYGFNGVMKEEHANLENWLKARGVRCKNEMADEAEKIYAESSDDGVSDDEEEARPAKSGTIMDIDDEDESEDEDYVGEDSGSSTASGEEESEEE